MYVYVASFGISATLKALCSQLADNYQEQAQQQVVQHSRPNNKKATIEMAGVSAGSSCLRASVSCLSVGCMTQRYIFKGGTLKGGTLKVVSCLVVCLSVCLLPICLSEKEREGEEKGEREREREYV